jgi:hypothetical protein
MTVITVTVISFTSVKYAPTLDNYGQSYFARRDLKKMKCVCKTQMMPAPDLQNPVDIAYLHYVYQHSTKY